MVTWSCLWVSIRTNPNFEIIGMKFDSTLSFEDHVHSIVSSIFQRISILRLMKCVFVDTSVLLHCFCAFVLPILEYCSPVWWSAAECPLQLLERQGYSGARHCLNQFLGVVSSMSCCWTVYVVQG